jgi:NADPH:quinone reductase
MSEDALVVVATAYGGPEVLRLIREPVAEPGPGEVLLEVRAAGVNPADWKAYGGMMGNDPKALPMRLGREASGVVTAVGPGGADGPAGEVSVGDEVIAFRIAGAYADRLIVGAEAVVPKPAALSFEQAGGLMLVGTTAVHALSVVGVGEGETLLVHGASGGVGRVTTQVARTRGARVIGTASPAHHEELREMGAEPVAYGDCLLERVRAIAPEGVDAAIDTIGTDEAMDVSLALVAERDRIATIANFGRGFTEGVKVLGGGPGADPGVEIRAAARLELVRLAEEGKLTLKAVPYPLIEVAVAHRESIAGHPAGKLVLVP